MRYFVMALSIACLDLGKEDSESEDNSDNASENVNSRFVSMTSTSNSWVSWNREGMLELGWDPDSMEGLEDYDCTAHYVNDDEAIDIDCEICDVYGFLIYTERSGDCDADTDYTDPGYGVNFEIGMIYASWGTAWVDSMSGNGGDDYYDCTVTESSATCTWEQVTMMDDWEGGEIEYYSNGGTFTLEY